MVSETPQQESATSVVTYYYTINANGTLSRSKSSSTVNIAPMNAMFQIEEEISSFFSGLDLSQPPEFPPKWDWRTQGNVTISPVMNQWNCGCCWAVSVTQCLNDSLVCSGIFAKNPNIDVTTILSCFDESMETSEDKVLNIFQKCMGGSSLNLLEFIKQNGIYQNNGYSYESWCDPKNKYCQSVCTSKNPICTPYLMEEINRTIPKPVFKCGKKKTCCTGKNKNDINPIYVDNIETPSIKPDQISPETLTQCQSHIKKHIYKYGPMVCCFPIPYSFVTGDFQISKKNENAIYFDSYDYQTNTFKENVRQPSDYHAMSVVGWGIDTNVDPSLYGGTTKKDVPYWIVRNSWGTKWGIEGFVYVAMYPFNKICQISTVSTNGQTQNGILLFEPSIVPPTLSAASNEAYEYMQELEKKTVNFSPFQIFIIVTIIFIILLKLFS